VPADFSLTDRVIVVTGASRGIGEEIARAAAAAGAVVVLASRKQEGLEEVAATIHGDGGTALAVATHTGRPEEVKALFDRVMDEYGAVHGLVNNAATNVHFGPMVTVDDAAWDKNFEVNVKGYFYCSREFASRAEGGSIVNVASVVGLRAAPLQSVYGMTKASVISMTRSLAMELGPAGIRVNAIAPGLVETRFAQVLVDDPSSRDHFVARTFLGRHAQPDEIAGTAIYLLSDASSYTTGQVIAVDGGMTAN
jgi:NAD(P)-dependent dehydrogenase (short-subunit alcohol dehydrogenase family)